LIIDDSGDDALLVVRALERAGYDARFERVERRDEMERALQHPPQIILCDYSMPAFSSLEALTLLHARKLDIPLVIVSGTIGEQRAVEVMRAGARDYVCKDNLTRLGVTVERELREAANRAEQRALKEQLLLCERMASIGLLAAGVVHEINNPLLLLLAGVEQVEAELLSARANADPHTHVERAFSELRRVSDSCERIERIVADVRLFSRGESARESGADVRAVVESSLRLAMHEIARRCRLTTSFQPTAQVAISPTRLGQVCLNLILNAAQAIPEGRMDQHEIHVAVRGLLGHWVELEVSDDGCGIPERLGRSVFQPFVTTKPAALGTGLGLFITHRIVTEAGGSIEFTSQPGRGTTFRVTLPPSMSDGADEPRPGSQRRGPDPKVDAAPAARGATASQD
jgi:signal transduction histidine kinase